MLSSFIGLLLMTDIVQVRNPRSNRYVKVDRSLGKIISIKKSPKPYKGIPIARRKKS